mgnify:CR=1 FL=1
MARLIAQSAVQPGVSTILGQIAQSAEGAPDFRLIDMQVGWWVGGVGGMRAVGGGWRAWRRWWEQVVALELGASGAVFGQRRYVQMHLPGSAGPHNPNCFVC